MEKGSAGKSATAGNKTGNFLSLGKKMGYLVHLGSDACFTDTILLGAGRTGSALRYAYSYDRPIGGDRWRLDHYSRSADEEDSISVVKE